MAGERTHSGEKPHMLCVSVARLQPGSPTSSSTRGHTLGSSHVCQECGKGLARSSPSSGHRRTHLEEKTIGAVTAGWASATGPTSSHTRGRTQGRSRTSLQRVWALLPAEVHTRQPPEDTLKEKPYVCGEVDTDSARIQPLSRTGAHTP